MYAIIVKTFFVEFVPKIPYSLKVLFKFWLLLLGSKSIKDFSINFAFLQKFSISDLVIPRGSMFLSANRKKLQNRRAEIINSFFIKTP